MYLNDLLSSGHIPDLYTKDEQQSITEELVEVVKAKGISPEPSACWNYFIQQVCLATTVHGRVSVATVA